MFSCFFQLGAHINIQIPLEMSRKLTFPDKDSFIFIRMMNTFIHVFSLQRFQTAAEDVKKLKSKPSDQDLLEIYALFKQGSIGDVNTRK